MYIIGGHITIALVDLCKRPHSCIKDPFSPPIRFASTSETRLLCPILLSHYFSMSVSTYTSSPIPSIHTNSCNMQPISSIPKSQFVFVQINGNICLAQLRLNAQGSTSSALSFVDATIFIHEFINIFRFSHQTTIHPSDIRFIDPIDERCTKYEEDNGTVFLAKDVMERLRKLTVDVGPAPGRPLRH